MKAAIRKSINAIIKDRQHGASWLTGCAIKVLLDACDITISAASPKFPTEIAEIVAALVAARPGMTSIANYSLKFGEEFKSEVAGSRSLVNLQKKGYAIATRLNQLNERASQLLPGKAAHLVKNRSIVMTCSYSDSICLTLEQARSKGVDFKVLAIQSSFNKFSYGQMTADRLHKAKISCRVVPDDQIRWHAARADIVLIGADAVSLQGWLLNGAPTYELARVAVSRKIPVHAICSKSKFDPRGFLASMREPEAGFDMVPLDLIAGIVTETATYKAADIYSFTFEDIFRSKSARPH
jgi:translation initiation factor 2B subunit (eIF-2B alpha/beta/delta family)